MGERETAERFPNLYRAADVRGTDNGRAAQQAAVRQPAA